MEKKEQSKYPEGYDNTARDETQKPEKVQQKNDPSVDEIRKVDSYPGSSGQSTRK